MTGSESYDLGLNVYSGIGDVPAAEVDESDGLPSCSDVWAGTAINTEVDYSNHRGIVEVTEVGPHDPGVVTGVCGGHSAARCDDLGVV